MAKYFILSVLLLICFQLSQAQESKLDSLLLKLDETIADAQVYVEQKETMLTKLRNQLKSVSSDQLRYDISLQLYNEYRSYKYDSAFAYAEKMQKYAENIKNPDLIAEAKIAKTFSCLSAGLYKEAVEISNSIDTVLISNDYKSDYYSCLSTLYLSMSDFSAGGSHGKEYRKLALKYCRHAIVLLPATSHDALMQKIREKQLMDEYWIAVDLAKQYLALNEPDLHDKAIAESMLGFFHEVRTDTALAIESFARAAMIDIKLAVKETSAIRQLAELLFLKGDISHAYKYAMLALDDANFYNARQRKIEVGRTLPIIEAGRFAIIEEQKHKILIYAVLASSLLLLFAIASVIIFLQKKRLNSARLLILRQNKDLHESNQQLLEVKEAISRQNDELLKINNKLKEVDRIKDEYIGYFFNANSVYISKMEEFQKMIARKIRNGQFEELAQQFTASGLRKEKEDMFVLFDQIMMKIFPDFIDRYNLLFKEEDKVIIRPGNPLTPELRIFALIRLGISESERIAHFLDFSLSTVKNYKTKAKNRSIIANELFESKIMEIESVS